MSLGKQILDIKAEQEAIWDAIESIKTATLNPKEVKAFREMMMPLVKPKVVDVSHLTRCWTPPYHKIEPKHDCVSGGITDSNIFSCQKLRETYCRTEICNWYKPRESQASSA